MAPSDSQLQPRKDSTRGIVSSAERKEGGTLSYLLRIGGHEIFIMGSMNYVERDLTGLRPV
jgi:hypothetical protein